MGSEDVNFFKFHLGDYDGATAHLSWDEDMAYMRLLRAYYRREQPITPAEAYRLCRAMSKAQRAAVDSVLGEFFTQAPDGWHNKRADLEVAAYQAQASTNKRIARERSDRRPSTNLERTVNDSLPDRSPNHQPLTTNHEPLTRKEDQHQSFGNGKKEGNGANGVVVIPLLDKTGWQVPPEFQREMEAAYPAVDGPATLREIRAWCIANPDRCKPVEQVQGFINGWFERTQNA